MRLGDARYLCALPAIATISLVACNQITPNGTPDTIALLNAGSEQACVTAEVQQDLKDMILPKAGQMQGDGSSTDKEAVRAMISLSFDTTTMQSVDKSVRKVSCSTTVHVADASGHASSFRLDYAVSPSAEDPNHVVIASDVDDARSYTNGLLTLGLTALETKQADDTQAAAAQQARQQLLATITPRWLVGSWIETNSDPINCRNGNAFIFAADHGFSGAFVGRWTLDSDQLHVIGHNRNGPINLIGTITAADALSFTLSVADEAHENGFFRRCTRDEMQPADTDPLPTIDNADAPPSD